MISQKSIQSLQPMYDVAHNVGVPLRRQVENILVKDFNRVYLAIERDVSNIMDNQIRRHIVFQIYNIPNKNL